jgi:motility quorum-sensing regulator / GCU-specific mRNA interferase toxin
MRIMTEKRQPTYDLEAFKASFSSVERLAVTGTALRSAAVLGCGRAEIVATIQTMKREHFCKSMTAYADHGFGSTCTMSPQRLGCCMSVKFTADVLTKFLLLSFKEKENDR